MCVYIYIHTPVCVFTPWSISTFQLNIGTGSPQPISLLAIFDGLFLGVHSSTMDMFSRSNTENPDGQSIYWAVASIGFILLGVACWLFGRCWTMIGASTHLCLIKGGRLWILDGTRKGVISNKPSVGEFGWILYPRIVEGHGNWMQLGYPPVPPPCLTIW